MVRKVVIIGHGYTSRLGVVRALGREGYEVTVIVMTGFSLNSEAPRIPKPIDCYSKYVHRILFCTSEKEKLVELLLAECIDPVQKVVLFPDSDFSTAVVDQNADRLKEFFLFPHIGDKQGAVVSWMDKIRQKKMAEVVGLNVAKGWRIDVQDGIYDIPSDLCYPCFPKPLATLSGGKKGLKRCNNEAELHTVLKSFSETNPTISILVEEFKTIDVEQALLGFSDGCEVVIPGIIQTKSLAQGGHFGVAKQGIIMPLSGFEGLIDKFKRFVLNTGFVGLFDIDFYQSGGESFFCEINFRYGGSGYAYTAMGVNLPVIFVKTLLGESTKEMNKIIREEAVFTNERMCLDDWYYGYISTQDYKKLLRGSDISFIFDKEDKAPQFRYIIMFWKLYLKRLVKHILRYSL